VTSTGSIPDRGLRGTLVATLIELLLLTAYVSQDVAYHWLVHFLVGGTVALLGLTAATACRHRPATQPTLWVLLGHLVAIFPDLLFAAGIAHQRWMDLFLGHVSSHNVPGGLWTLYGSFLAGLALYRSPSPAFLREGPFGRAPFQSCPAALHCCDQRKHPGAPRVPGGPSQ